MNTTQWMEYHRVTHEEYFTRTHMPALHYHLHITCIVLYMIWWWACYRLFWVPDLHAKLMPGVARLILIQWRCIHMGELLINSHWCIYCQMCVWCPHTIILISINRQSYQSESDTIHHVWVILHRRGGRHPGIPYWDIACYIGYHNIYCIQFWLHSKKSSEI